ncbi:MAG: carbohydrate ABC transporter permease [Chloroflexi bacterium]|nr:MAG: carbohydrate ABC transporter permease [Chloroflexota bacterium]
MTEVRVDPTPSAPSEARQSSMPMDQRIRRLFLYAGSVLLAVMFSSPFVFSVASSLKTVAEIHAFPPTLLPEVPQWENYVTVFSLKGVPFAQFYLNSALITFTSMFGTIATAAVSAYGFARFKWPGRDAMFMVLLSTLVLPEEVVLIPKFLMFNNVPKALIGKTLIDTYWPLILPSWFGGGAFNVFLLRQFFMQIPRDFDEAAVLDGASSWQIFWMIMLPLSRPALATVAVFSFLGQWNDFIHPLIYLNTSDKFPLSLGLRYFQQQPTDAMEPREHLLMAASLLMVAPAITVYLFAQRYFVRGIVMSGIKG